jgi:hypothetical protein
MKKTIPAFFGCIFLSIFSLNAQAVTLDDLEGSYQSMVYGGLTIEISGNKAISKGSTASKSSPGFAKGRVLITDITNTPVPPKKGSNSYRFPARCSTIDGDGPYREARCNLSAERDPVRGTPRFSISLDSSERKGSAWPKILSGYFNRSQP